jgi:predicted dehydrogenase
VRSAIPERRIEVSEQWKIGLVGCGRGSSYGHLSDHDSRCDIIALCDSGEHALARHQRELELADSQCFTKYEDLIASSPKLDVVVVGTPIPAHAEQAVLALDAGINVMSEVTAATTIDGCARIIEAVRRSGKLYMLAENEIFRPFFAEWAKLLEAGKLGEVFYAEADYLHPIHGLLIDPKTGEKHWRADRPPVHYCSHSLGPILYLTGDRIVRAMAIGDGHRIIPEAGVGGTDIQLAAFETKGNMIIKMTRTQAAPRHRPIHYHHLQGTNGFVETDRRGRDMERDIQRGLLYIKDEMEHTQEVEWPELHTSAPEWATLGGHGTSDYTTFMQFLSALETGRKPVLNEVRAWDLTVPGLVAAESAAKGGQWMDVPPPPE